MEITWLGHSCFRLRWDRLALITDPFPDSVGLSLEETSALAATISHDHPNHSYWQELGEDVKVFNGPGEYELSGILIRGVLTPLGVGDPPGKRNTAYHIEMEGLRLCHLGDISGILSARQVDELAPVDVLFMPVGEGCTVGLSQALEIIRALSPRVVVPMHYRLPGLQVELKAEDAFLREMGLTDVAPQARLSITNSTLPQEMRVVMLEAQGLRP